MTNTNPNLTATLVALRDGLLEQRSNIRGHRDNLLAQLAEIDADLDDNATRIEAVDEVVAIHDPDHVRLEVRNSDTPTPLVVTPRTRQLQLTADSEGEATQTAPKSAVETATAPEASVEASLQPAAPTEASAPTAPTATKEAAADSVVTSAEPAKKTRAKRSIPTESVGDTAEAPVTKVKPKRSAASKILISRYFAQFDKLKLIVKSLESRGQPTSAGELGTDIKAMYPIDLADQELRDIFSSNVSAYLYHMLKVGLITKEMRFVENGRDLVVFKLADGYRKLLKARKPKVKTAPKKNKATAEKPARDQRTTDTPVNEPAMAD
jgi:hypothetical protein